MSGFEIAGIVLGAFPLVISLLGSYGEGWQKLDGLYHHGKELSKFHRDLDAEWTIFRNICDNLLESLETPGSRRHGRSWDSPDVQHVLKQRLNSRTAIAFLASVGDMNDVIATLRNMYPEDLDLQAKSSSRAYAKMVRKRFKFHVMAGTHQDCLERATKINSRLQTLVKTGSYAEAAPRRNRQAAKTIKFYRTIREHAIGLYATLKEKLEHPGCICSAPHDTGLRLDVRDVDMRTDLDFVPSSLTKSPIRFCTYTSIQVPGGGCTWQAVDVEPEVTDPDDSGGPPKDSGDYFGKMNAPIGGRLSVPAPPLISNRSRSPLRSLRSKFGSRKVRFESQTDIRIPHTATALPTPPSSNGSFRNSSSSESTLQTMLPKPSPSPPPIPTIDILCRHLLSLHLSTPQLPPSYVYLESINPNNTPRRIRISATCVPSRKRPHRPVTPLILQPHTVTLKDLFHRCGYAFHLSLKYRLQLALRLASSILQLYSTGWLGDEWDSSDILFLEDSTGDVLLDSPLVSGRLRRRNMSGIGAGGKSKSSLLIPVWCTTNPALLSLGIVLLELWHGRSFEEYENEAAMNPSGSIGQQIQGCAPASRKVYLACYLANMLKDNAGSDFESAVRGCVKGLDVVSGNDLDNSVYMEAVYTRIACPLKQALEKAFPSYADI